MRFLGAMSLLVAGASAGVVLSDGSTLDRFAHLTGLEGLQLASGWSRNERNFAPQQPLRVAKGAEAGPGADRARMVEQESAGDAPIPTAAIETATLPARAQPARIESVPLPVLVKRGSAMQPTDEVAQSDLARRIQTELKRVGCYDGNIDGDWGPAAKRAMKAFTDRVNAALPMEQPDYILLTLVRGYPQKACGAGCASGEVAGEGGRCMPRAIMARGGTPAIVKPDTAAIRTATPTPAKRAPQQQGWSTNVIAAPVPVARPAPSYAPEHAALTERKAGQPAAPLPGRMAVGGPASIEPVAVAAPPAAAVAAPQGMVPAAASGVAANETAPAPAPKAATRRRSASSGSSGGGSRSRSSYDGSSYERTFKNPKVVREFFFGRGG